MVQSTTRGEEYSTHPFSFGQSDKHFSREKDNQTIGEKGGRMLEPLVF